MKPDHLAELTSIWIQFHEETGGGDVQSFEAWLLNRRKAAAEAEPEGALRGEIGFALGTLFRFVTIWEKKAFADLPVRGLMEFGALATVEEQGFPTKSEVIKELLVEQSTGFEVLKKLVREGFLAEVTDSDDLRSVRLKMTPAGRRVLAEVFVRVRSLSMLLLGDLSDDELGVLKRILMKLNRYHHEVHGRQRTNTWKTLEEQELRYK
jgi:DNA-binding MarR family transcriptional regulator